MALCGLWWIAADCSSFSASLKEVSIPLFMTKYSATPQGNRCARLRVHATAAERSNAREEKLSSKPFAKGRKCLDMCWELYPGPRRWTPVINRPPHSSIQPCLRSSPRLPSCRVLKRCIVLTSRNFRRSDSFISLDLDWIYSIKNSGCESFRSWRVKSCSLTSNPISHSEATCSVPRAADKI